MHCNVVLRECVCAICNVRKSMQNKLEYFKIYLIQFNTNCITMHTLKQNTNSQIVLIKAFSQTDKFERNYFFCLMGNAIKNCMLKNACEVVNMQMIFILTFPINQSVYASRIKSPDLKL